MSPRALTLLAVSIAACASRPPPVDPPPLDELLADDETRASIAGIVLPRMPPDVEPDDPDLEEGWRRAAQALSMPTPRPPHGEAWEVEEWADQELASWMRRRAEAVGAAQRALEQARMGRREASVVASAILGLAYSRFALDLRGIPTPEVFARDPERARAFQEALRRATAPLWQRALDAFGSCSSTAGAAPAHSLDQWREFCDEEIESAAAMLPDDGRDDEDERR
ncbi:MAG TPA: hypothetical protein VIL20_25040 [Sandaracinaceae bacterium]